MDSATAVASDDEQNAIISKLNAMRSSLTSIVVSSTEQNKNLDGVGCGLSIGLETVALASDIVAPLQTQSIAARALQTRINRAVSPALSVLHSFSLVESLQRRLISLATDDTGDRPQLSRLLQYVDCVDRLNMAIGAVMTGCEPAVLKLQEAVEFLSRTKATDQLRIRRLRETLGAIKALYKGEVDTMRYEGLLDEALLRLQDEYKGRLQQIRHTGIVEGNKGEGEDDLEVDGLDQMRELGSNLEVEVLGRISETLATNDCLDICIDIYVKVRYRRAAKALMRLNPRYLKTFEPEDINKMEWEALESAITLWIEHFKLAVNVVFVAEKKLCKQVLSGIMDGTIWPECFAKIADKIMAVFFRFGEGVAHSSKEPQKLFKLLDMYDAMDRIRPEFTQVFDGDSGIDICARFRELQKLLVHAASKVFWEFGLQIEGLEDGAPPPPDGAVPKVVRYAVNYLKCLAGSGYAAAMGQILRTKQMWKVGFLARPEPDECLMRDAVSNALDALQRNLELKKSRYRDKVLPHVLAMNTYWYMYMRTRGSELAKLVGEDTMKKKYKTAAEEAAYSYQAQAWGPLMRLLEREESPGNDREGSRAVVSGKMEVFMKEFDENLRRHQSCYCIPDRDLREQIKESVAKAVLPAYAGFLHSYSEVMQGRTFLPPDSIKELLGKLFGGEEKEMDRKSIMDGGRMNFKRREFRNRADGRTEQEEHRNFEIAKDGYKERGDFETLIEQDQTERNLENREERVDKEEGRFARRDGGEEESLAPREAGNERRRNFRKKDPRDEGEEDYEKVEKIEDYEKFGMIDDRTEGVQGFQMGEEMKGEASFGRRDIIEREGENCTRKKKEVFNMGEDHIERKGGSFGKNEDEFFKRKKEEIAINNELGDFRNQEDKKIENEETGKTKNEKTYIRRRELHNQYTEKTVEGDKKGRGWRQESENGERKYFRRGEFKSRVNRGGGTLHNR